MKSFQLEIPLPNRDAREKIFEKLLKRPGLKVSKKWEKYIQLTDEWNCSKIENFIQVIKKMQEVNRDRLQSNFLSKIYRLICTEFEKHL